MSASARALRALSLHSANRRLIPKTSTLVPFLYQTSTIQQCRYLQYSGDPLPFDNILEEGKNVQSKDTDLRSARKSTITSTELKTFEKLLKNMETQSNQDQEVSQEQSFLEDYEKGDEDSDLDSIFDSISRNHNGARRSKRKGDELVRVSVAMLREDQRLEHLEKKEALRGDMSALNLLQYNELYRIRQLLADAKTDTEVWDILSKELFSVIRALDLDGTGTTSSSKSTEAPKKKRRGRARKTTEAQKAVAAEPSIEPLSTTEDSSSSSSSSASQLTAHTDKMRNLSKPDKIRILAVNYPLLLTHTCNLLHTSFPASALPLALLPTIKDLGRSSYQLGASTALYNALIKHTWLTYASYDAVTELLQDMENGGIEHNTGTWKMLDKIIGEANAARKGRYGDAVRKVWAIDMFGGGDQRVRWWREVVGERLQKEAVRRKQRVEDAGRDDVGMGFGVGGKGNVDHVYRL